MAKYKFVSVAHFGFFFFFRFKQLLWEYSTFKKIINIFFISKFAFAKLINIRRIVIEEIPHPHTTLIPHLMLPLNVKLVIIKLKKLFELGILNKKRSRKEDATISMLRLGHTGCNAFSLDNK